MTNYNINIRRRSCVIDVHKKQPKYHLSFGIPQFFEFEKQKVISLYNDQYNRSISTLVEPAKYKFLFDGQFHVERRSEIKYIE